MPAELMQLQQYACYNFCWTLFKFYLLCILKVETAHANRFMSFTQGPKLDFDFNNNIHRINETLYSLCNITYTSYNG